MPDKDPVFCVDCKFCVPKKFFGITLTLQCVEYHALRDKGVNPEYLVTGKGKNEPNYFSCAMQRKQECGTRGKFFESKDRLVQVEKKLDAPFQGGHY